MGAKTYFTAIYFFSSSTAAPRTRYIHTKSVYSYSPVPASMEGDVILTFERDLKFFGGMPLRCLS